jgi:Bacterial PH domain
MAVDQKDKNPLPEGEVLRVSDQQAAGTFFAGLFLLLVGAATLLSNDGGHNVPLWVAPVTGVAGIAFGIYLMARSRAGLTVERDGVSVQGAFRRRHWTWRELRHFELGGGQYGPALWIETVDGERVGARGFQARSKDQKWLVKERVSELNARVEAARPQA